MCVQDIRERKVEASTREMSIQKVMYLSKQNYVEAMRTKAQQEDVFTSYVCEGVFLRAFFPALPANLRQDMSLQLR